VDALDERGGNKWPTRLWLVRHGQSAGNAARDAAEAASAHVIAIADRDVDVPLSPLGVRQSQALAAWFADLSPTERPTALLTSPYRRAMETATAIASATGLSSSAFTIDERLRERELGMFNRLTRRGIADRYPEQDELRSRIGKFYYRPPSGESWCDVILRLRSVSAELQLQHASERVLVVAHQAIVLCFRYLLEGMTEAQILEVDRKQEVANCSITSYERCRDGHGRIQMCLDRYNFVVPVAAAGEPVTRESDEPVAPR
jgi:broad specificity phosphatase PhoE